MKYLLYIYIILAPFYFFPSGLPQLADLIMIFLIVGLIIKGKFYKNISIGLFLIFVIYICVINFIFIFLTQELNPLIFNLYYIYNFFVLIALYSLYKSFTKSNFKEFYNILCLTIIIQLFVTLFINDSSLRATNFFNNPNQLAYFVLIVQTLIVIIKNKLHLIINWHFLSYLMSVYIIFMTGSRGALAGILILVLTEYILLKLNGKKLIITIVTFFCIYILYQFRHVVFTLNSEMSNLYSRIFESDDSGVLSDRGYQRILNFPEYIIFGAGEGYVSRLGLNMELHSLMGTVLFSYGILGSLIVIIILIRFMYIMKFHILFLIGIFIYNLSHNGIRESLLWMLFALVIALYEERKK